MNLHTSPKQAHDLACFSPPPVSMHVHGAHTRAHTRTHMHMHTHMYTHMHTHTSNLHYSDLDNHLIFQHHPTDSLAPLSSARGTAFPHDSCRRGRGGPGNRRLGRRVSSGQLENSDPLETQATFMSVRFLQHSASRGPQERNVCFHPKWCLLCLHISPLV